MDVGSFLSPELVVIALMLVIFIYVGFKVIQYLVKLVMIAVIFALMPIALNFLGFGIEMTISNIVWFGFLGIVVFFGYKSLKTGFKALKWISKPLKRMEGKSKKQKEKEERKKMLEHLREEEAKKQEEKGEKEKHEK